MPQGRPEVSFPQPIREREIVPRVRNNPPVEIPEYKRERAGFTTKPTFEDPNISFPMDPQEVEEEVTFEDPSIPTHWATKISSPRVKTPKRTRLPKVKKVKRRSIVKRKRVTPAVINPYTTVPSDDSNTSFP